MSVGSSSTPDKRNPHGCYLDLSCWPAFTFNQVFPSADQPAQSPLSDSLRFSDATLLTLPHFRSFESLSSSFLSWTTIPWNCQNRLRLYFRTCRRRSVHFAMVLDCSRSFPHQSKYIWIVSGIFNEAELQVFYPQATESVPGSQGSYLFCWEPALVWNHVKPHLLKSLIEEWTRSGHQFSVFPEFSCPSDVKVPESSWNNAYSVPLCVKAVRDAITYDTTQSRPVPVRFYVSRHLQSEQVWPDRDLKRGKGKSLPVDQKLF